MASIPLSHASMSGELRFLVRAFTSAPLSTSSAAVACAHRAHPQPQTATLTLWPSKRSRRRTDAYLGFVEGQGYLEAAGAGEGERSVAVQVRDVDVGAVLDEDGGSLL